MLKLDFKVMPGGGGGVGDSIYKKGRDARRDFEIDP